MTNIPFFERQCFGRQRKVCDGNCDALAQCEQTSIQFMFWVIKTNRVCVMIDSCFLFLWPLYGIT